MKYLATMGRAWCAGLLFFAMAVAVGIGSEEPGRHHAGPVAPTLPAALPRAALGIFPVAGDDPLSDDPSGEDDAQPGAPSDSAQQDRKQWIERERELADRQRRLLERIWSEQRGHEPSIHERSHETVKAAFRECVATARRSTVRVLSDGKQVALGAVVRADGLIVTKASQMRGKITCDLGAGSPLPAEKLVIDDKNDLALLRVKAHGLSPVEWSSAAQIPVGSWLATCGLGVDPLAVGVVSVAARQIRPPRGILGVLLAEDSRGARIGEILPGSAATEAGLESGDIIIEINGHKIDDRQAMVRVTSSMQSGDKVSLRLMRGGKDLRLHATLGTADMDGLRADRFNMMNMLGGPLSERRAGFTSAIQHDTVLEPEECGGPVVDLDGKVVGINIARAGRVNSYAIPAAVVERLLRSQWSMPELQPLAQRSLAR